MPFMFSYVAYGLSIASEIQLPELEPDADEGPEQVTFRLGEVSRRAGGAPLYGNMSWERDSDGRFRIFSSGVGAFEVCGGREVVVEPDRGAEEAALRLFLLGPALAVLLERRGFLVFHASASLVHGAAISFLGGAGWGKSTLAAALHARGHPVLADDFAAVTLDDPYPLVVPGFPRLKLWPDSASSLGVDVGGLPRLRSATEKRSYRAAHGFTRQPAPLRQIYLLSKGDGVRTEPLRPQDRLMELVRHSYAVRKHHCEERGSHLQRCARLGSAVEVRRLSRPLDLSLVPDVVAFLEEDVARSTRQFSPAVFPA